LLKIKGLLRFIFIKNARKLAVFRSTAAASISCFLFSSLRETAKLLLFAYEMRFIFQKSSGILFLLLLMLTTVRFVSAQTSGAAEIPQPTGFVNDYAGVIDQPTKQRLEAKLKRLREATQPPIEFAVCVVTTTNGADAFQYSLEVARAWKIGTKETDSPGLLLFVAIKDRKYFTQISRHLEGDLTDGEAGQIQRNVLVPAFRQQQYGKGIEDTLNAYIKNIAQTRGFDADAIIGEQTAQPNSSPEIRTSTDEPKTDQSLVGTCCATLIILFIMLFIMSSGRRGGGGGGGLLNGLLWGLLFSNLTRGGGWSGGSFGGSSDSGWSSGGGSSWGGFGGGGDFGGGGAGGDW
jgi:uncharacterized protein